MQFYQPQNGYCYNSDTIFLYGFIERFAPKGRVLDVGCGCGVLGLLVARDCTKVALEAVEKQEAFVELAAINARVNGISLKLHHGDFLEFEDAAGYDYIISNPPFYNDGASLSQNEMKAIARSNTSLPLQPFLEKVSKLLKPHGHLLFCYDASQFALVAAAVVALGMRITDARFVHSKIDRVSKLVLLHVRKNSKALMKVHPPLIAFEGDEFSHESLRLYEKADTHTIKCVV